MGKKRHLAQGLCLHINFGNFQIVVVVVVFGNPGSVSFIFIDHIHASILLKLGFK